MSGTATTIHNERVKLLATALNNAALAFIVAGFIAPLVTGQLQGGWRAAAIVLWVGLGVGLHFSARGVLGRLL
jgi:hypothetical protein